MTSVPAPLSDQQALQRIDPIFHAHWSHLRKTRLLDGERIFAVEYQVSSHSRWTKSLLGPESTYWPWFGLLLVTSGRFLRLRFAADKRRTWICYRQDQIIRHLKDYWVTEPTGSLTEQESKEWEVDEAPFSKVKSVNFEELRLRNGQEFLHLIRLGLEGVSKTVCQYDAGHRVYQLLQTAASNGGRLENQPQSKLTDPLQPLKHLIEMRQSGMLTEAEFSAAKAKLLGL